MRRLVRTDDCRSFLPPTGAFCGVASAFACIDFLFDFVALRRRIGADSTFAVAAIACCPSQRHSRAGSDSTFAPRSRRGTAGGSPGSRNASTCAGDRRSSRTGAGSAGYGASDHPGQGAEA